VHCRVSTGHLLSDEIGLLLAVREWEREGMGITNGNGNTTRLNLGGVMEMEMGLKGIEEDIRAHL